ncbi:hypothetical protein [Pseudaestuariivita rosea]|uniref:hypothetical protein n=1 Tax=Pseudaestuariivita rosea TaxID=2763263 RepID=UPI001ABB33E3|nr:hypothetical protein [Pseudaestuariivita rosea]
MAKHILDQDHGGNDTLRVQQFLKLERRKATSSIVRKLRQRPRTRQQLHVQKYLRIARGELA